MPMSTRAPSRRIPGQVTKSVVVATDSVT